MSILNNALSGALASQLALSSSSQNIANLQTKGYTRQTALLSAVAPAAGTAQAGNGVRVTSLLRFSDNYKTQQLWRTGSDLGQYSQTQPYLTQLEKVMGDDEASLSNGVDTFFAALNAVAGVDPTSTPLRQQVVTAAGLLSQRFNSLNNVFNAQLQSVRQQRTAIVDSANSSIAAIAALNTQIANANASGSNASNLIDTRDQAIDSLASQMALEVSDQPDGTRNVSLRSGQALVLGGVAGKLAVSGGADQTFSLTFAGTKFDLDVTNAGGQLGGLTSYEKNTLLPLQQNVGEMAKHIADQVNTQLGAGYTMDNKLGKPMFVYTPGNTSNMLQLADGYQTSDLAFSGDGTPGDTGNLRKLVDIKSGSVSMTGIGSVMLSDADTQLVGRLAVNSQQNQGALSTAQSMRDSAMDDWQSTSGVNQDEEAVHLVEYQNMYQANMKVMSVANALFDATLAMMG
ncbi:flagellar hook protein FlgK [Massilia sp. WF1]|uniref:flagellar hook-associated protein FlgK n=1 Tax=unclassified Massilia TaxID=2609279 RepID=UPI0006494AC7|nr:MULTISPECIES: flagellar hook-associated protein FlgK [unclassified Massilia]ALK96034.1 flagellar biosynthesis protein FlgK [Massilia sp. WG5]KLU37384.1 flagellar hook protein FlgK [Massilia sp. WF1]